MISKTHSPAPTNPWRKDLMVLYGAALLTGTTVGLFNPMLSLKMKAMGFSDMLIGAASSLFFLGVIIVAPLAAYVARHQSLRTALLTGLTLASIGVSLFSLAQSLAQWLLFRLLLAAGIGFYMVGGQCAINTLAPRENISLVNGLYALSFGLGLGVGPMAGAALLAMQTPWAFIACAAFLWIAIPIVAIGLPKVKSAESVQLRGDQIKQMSLPLHAVFSYGVTESILMSLFPIVLMDRGLTLGEMGLAFSVFVLGGRFLLFL